MYLRVEIASGSSGRAWQVTASGVGAVTSVAVMLGIAIARFTTSTRQSTLIVVAGVAIAGALVGGCVAAPSLCRLASRDDAADQDAKSSSLR